MAATNSFTWYELMTTDMPAAETFYSTVAGWKMADAGMPQMRYTLASTDKGNIAGIMELPQEAKDQGTPPCWVGYINVENVDQAAEKLKQLGGHVHKAPADIPNVGRFAMVSDPHNAIFVLFSEKPASQPPPRDFKAPGYFSWHELYAGDLETAWTFYEKMFAWKKSQAIDMGGGVGIYQTFSDPKGAPLGGMMTKMPFMPVSVWNYYINVAEIGAGVERVKAAGGAVMMGPHQVPGGAWIAQCTDPQNAAFAIIDMSQAGDYYEKNA
jgi:predicted enzyme related to lactoylglutathione lyase